MPAILLAPPAAEPLTTAEAKSFLRVEHDDEDGVIASLISAARLHIEALTRRALLTQTWRLVCDAWPADGRLRLRIGPVQAVIAARVYDLAGNASAVDTGRFVVDAAADTVASPCWALPLPGRDTAGIELDLVCGYGAVASDVPEPLRHAIRLLVAQWYDNRGMAAPGTGVALLPGNVGALIAPYRILAL